MRIGIVLPHLKKYGGVRRYLEFGNQIIQRGHEYIIFLRDTTEEDWVAELDYKGSLKSVDELIQINLDACICGDADSLSYLKMASSPLKIVNVIFPPYSQYLLGNYKNYLYDPTFLIVGNSTGWEGPLEWHPHWFTIPGAINLDMFQPFSPPRSKVFKILFMAKNRPWKGMNTIMQVHEKLKDDSGIVWGYFDSEEHPELPSSFTPHINLHQKDMARLYSNYNVFISAEELAGWQNCAAEAMACGVPVITTAIGARDFAIHGETAFIAESVSDYLETIALLRKNKKVGQRVARAGRDQIQKFSWGNYSEKWLSFLTEQLRKKTDPYIINSAIESLGALVRADILLPSVGGPKVESKHFKIEETIRSAPIEEKVERKLERGKAPQEDMISAVKRKSKQLREYYQIANKIDTKIFDKYEKLGAYHWNSKDPVYQEYITFLKKIFEGISSFYGVRPILDVGGGDGFIASVLAEQGFSVHLIDTNETAIKLASEKLNGNKRVKVMKEDFFAMKEVPDIILMSQIIEHFEYPETVIVKLAELKPNILIISTPIQKDVGMWDPQYHYQEFSEQDFIDLLKPLSNEYTISYHALEPYNQFLICEKKSEALATYFRNLLGEAIDTEIIPSIVETVLSLVSNEIKRV